MFHDRHSMMWVDVPSEKCDKLIRHVTEVFNKTNLKIRDLATLKGKLVATDPGNKWERIRSMV